MKLDEITVSLVTPGGDGPVVTPGRVTKIGAGGCAVSLERAARGDDSPGVLLVTVADEEFAMLTAPVAPSAQGSTELELRFLPPVAADSRWADLVARCVPAP